MRVTPEYDRAKCELTAWAEAWQRRDEVVRAAWMAGLSKHHIHQITGLARSTVDRILPTEPREGSS
jgi:hypothetical protein